MRKSPGAQPVVSPRDETRAAEPALPTVRGADPTPTQERVGYRPFVYRCWTGRADEMMVIVMGIKGKLLALIQVVRVAWLVAWHYVSQ